MAESCKDESPRQPLDDSRIILHECLELARWRPAAEAIIEHDNKVAQDPVEFHHSAGDGGEGLGARR